MIRLERWWPALAVALACAMGAPGAVAADANTRVHWRLAEAGQAQAPRKVLILDSQIEVRELSAGGVTQKVPQLSSEASAHSDSALRRVLASRTDIVAVPMPALSETEQDEFDDTIATFDIVAGEAFAYTQPGLVGWEDRAARFDEGVRYERIVAGTHGQSKMFWASCKALTRYFFERARPVCEQAIESVRLTEL